MKSVAVVALLCSIYALLPQLGHSQCNIGSAKKGYDKNFPDIETKGVESYQMSVEYTAPDAKESNYYKEYYDLVERRGRVDKYGSSILQSYIYFTGTTEAWEIANGNCKLQNVSTIPSFMGKDMNEWLYSSADASRKTFGPSAMFKYALDTWNSKGREEKMAYMGKVNGTVRGLEAQYWRRCDTDTSYVDYYFTTDKEDDPTGLDMKRIPLRVFFGGTRKGRDEALSKQQFEILTFQPFISRNVWPFRLPKGLGCRRGELKDAPKLPDFSGDNLQLNAEVIYRKVDSNGEAAQYWSYYSTLFLALDLTSQHLAYYYTPWNASKYESDKEPTVGSAEYVIYDMKHGYAYTTNEETGECTISRQKDYVPKYRLPNGAGELSLTDPSILFPNSEMTYLSEGESRGVKVDIFEEIVENYILDNRSDVANPIKIPKAIISHSYFKANEIERGTVSVKKGLVQVELKFTGRQDKVTEILTLNFFHFSTDLMARFYYFNTQRCFKNDDSYSWVTIGFNADSDKLKEVMPLLPAIRSEILGFIQMNSELNPARIPIVMVDIKDGLFVTLLILGKPPVELDYLDAEVDKTITGVSEVEGIDDFQTCAKECLENENNCWGFSLCGAVCTFGVTEKAKVEKKTGCKLYRRYDNKTFIYSRDSQIENIKRDVKMGQVKLVLQGKDDKLIQLQATSIEVSDPGEDDRLFNRFGNQVNPRMRVVKAGAKLKVATGEQVKNLGRLRFDECQRVCLDFKDCESLSYCLTDSSCIISKTYGDEISNSSMEVNNMCSVLTRKYGDHFDRTPGNVLSLTAKEVLDLDTAEKCARACLKSSKYQCLSFDHCPDDKKSACKLHTVHYPNPKTREGVQTNSSGCGHYSRKFSAEFKKSPNKKTIGASLAPINNLTLEECSKSCMEYGKGTCYGFDFCQDASMYATSCVLLDSDPSRMKSTYSDFCTNYLRTAPQFTPRPYTNGYAGGIGFLCFVIGLVVGAVVVFGIAYIKVNRR